MRKSWMGQNFSSKERLSPTSTHVPGSTVLSYSRGLLEKRVTVVFAFWSLFRKEILNTTWQTEKIVWLLKMNSRMKYSTVNA